jgi:glycosyltransferase involved in cell wall biosynthesis
MRPPLLSVIIPTCKRPQFLPRSITSALVSAPEGDAEVIVVPNGADRSWKAVAQQFADDARVQWHPIPTAHANIARNAGLALARGKYVRFLDDDDFLLEGAHAQCLLLDASTHDASQGGIDLVDQNGNVFRQWLSSATEDYAQSMLRAARITHGAAMLYRRDRILNRKWDSTRHIGQDTAWALELARDLELSLHRCEAQTGVWTHHGETRISSQTGTLGHCQLTAQILLDAVRGIADRKALTSDRREAAAEGLWHCIHTAFALAPIYWTHVIKTVRRLAPNSLPNDAAYRRFPLDRLHPAFTEWMMLPHRSLRAWRYHHKRTRGLVPPW